MKFRRLWKSLLKNYTTSPVPSVALPQNHEWSPEGFRSLFRNCADVKMDKYDFGDVDSLQTVHLIYCEGLAEIQQINEYVLPRLESMLHHSKPGIGFDKKLELTRVDQTGDLTTRVFSGQLIIYFSNLNALYALDIASPLIEAPRNQTRKYPSKGQKTGSWKN